MIPDDVLLVVSQAWSEGFTTKSNIARDNADAIAESASRGLITTQSWNGEWLKRWQITPKGCRLLFKHKAGA